MEKVKSTVKFCKLELHALFYQQHFYKQRQIEIG